MQDKKYENFLRFKEQYYVNKAYREIENLINNSIIFIGGGALTIMSGAIFKSIGFFATGIILMNLGLTGYLLTKHKENYHFLDLAEKIRLNYEEKSGD